MILLFSGLAACVVLTLLAVLSDRLDELLLALGMVVLECVYIGSYGARVTWPLLPAETSMMLVLAISAFYERAWWKVGALFATAGLVAVNLTTIGVQTWQPEWGSVADAINLLDGLRIVVLAVGIGLAPTGGARVVGWLQPRRGYGCDEYGHFPEAKGLEYARVPCRIPVRGVRSPGVSPGGD